jgi:ankyrin repeat protein
VVIKSFYIEKLEDANGQELRHCFLRCSKQEIICVYSEGDNYYLRNSKDDSRPISALQHALFVQQGLIASMPTKRAVSSQCGGQQEIASFRTILMERGMLPPFVAKFQVSSIAKRETAIQAELQVKHGVVDQKRVVKLLLAELLVGVVGSVDLESVVFHLLVIKRAALSLELIKSQELALDMQNLEGTPLLCAATQASATALAIYLIEQGVCVDCQAPNSGNTPLHLALKRQNAPLVRALLDKDANLEITNRKGETPIFATTCHSGLGLFSLLRKAGANLQATTNDGYGLLAYALTKVRNSDYSLFLQLLVQGLDPNSGDPSPLHVAILNNDAQVIDWLLASGAKFDGAAKKVSPPILEALMRLSPQVMLNLIKLTDFDPNVVNQQGLNPLVVALRLANCDYVEALLQKGAKLPDQLNNEAEMAIVRGMRRMAAAQDYSAIELVLRSTESLPFKLLVLNEAVFPMYNRGDFRVLHWFAEGLVNTCDEAVQQFAIAKAKMEGVDKYRMALQLLFGRLAKDPNKKHWQLSAAQALQLMALGDMDLVNFVQCS